MHLFSGPAWVLPPHLRCCGKVRSRVIDLPVRHGFCNTQERDRGRRLQARRAGFSRSKEGYHAELVFSLNHELKHVAAARMNVRLARELAELNLSLEVQVAERTRELRADGQDVSSRFRNPAALDRAGITRPDWPDADRT